MSEQVLLVMRLSSIDGDPDILLALKSSLDCFGISMWRNESKLIGI